MQHNRDAEFRDQLLDGGEILICTFATMDMLRHALAAELGADDAHAYGLAAGEGAGLPDPGGDAARRSE